MDYLSARRVALAIHACALAAGLMPVAQGCLHAQTPSTLRDPQRGVFTAFPEATSYRALIRDVSLADRLRIEKGLPFKVHFDELGPHTVYVALRGRRPLGVVYVRGEESDWGFTEIAWAISVDLEVVGFQFHRCRDRQARALERSPFARGLAGRRFHHLAQLLTEEGKLATSAGAVPERADALAVTVLRSGMKALAVTDIMWREELGKLRDLQMALDAFPGGVRFRRFVFDAADAKQRRQAGRPKLLLRVRAVRVRGERGVLLGMVIQTTARRGQGRLSLRWRLDPEGRVLRVVPAATGTDASVRVACLELAGTRLLGSSTGAAAGQRSRDRAARAYMFRIKDELARLLPRGSRHSGAGTGRKGR